MLKILEKMFGNKSSKDVAELQPIVEEINEIYKGLQSLSDEELKAKTQEFRSLINNNIAELRTEIEALEERLRTESLSHADKLDLYDRLDTLEKDEHDIICDTLDELLPEVYAVVKETSRRMVGHVYKAADTQVEWKEVPYDVQLMGGIVLHQGKIAEMATGEGKTLTSVMPLYLNALAGRGVHLVTVNDYLARRDAEWMKPVFDFLGISIGCIQNNMPPHLRQEQYKCDITYGTNNEFGFDYLRDNMVTDKANLVQRGHFYCIVDEVDSALIDEARTPLIISGVVHHVDQQFEAMNPQVRRLVEAQKRLVAKLVSEAETQLAGSTKEDRTAAGIALLRAHRAFPKNPKLRKMLQEPDVERLLNETELEYLRDKGVRMQEVDEELYYAIDEKLHQIDLTDKGREFLVKDQDDKEMYILPDLSTHMSEIEGNNELGDDERQRRKDELMRVYAERSERIHTNSQLLRAYSLYEKDVEYVVQEGKVKIVDEFTGRIMEGRRYSDGLHQAIEAKEGVRVERDTQTLATVTLQNYFRLYKKLAGMTGTAETESGEFYEIYKLDVVVVPTNRPIIRKDLNDLIYRTKREKYNAIIDQVAEYNNEGRPVLVGTTSVEVSELLSKMMSRRGLKHNVLNAKQHQREAEIVADAGRKGAITIATNMAGRGTDIKLGPEVREAGGLAIVGTERHDARRIDRQLRGRSGRQGDPGSSRFYLSLEDNLMRLFGGGRIGAIMQRMKVPEGEPIEHKMVTKSVERAQKKVEENNFAIRKRTLEYDDVMNQQREVVYDRRRHALRGERLRGELFDYIEEMARDWFAEYHEAGNVEAFRNALRSTLLCDIDINAEQFASWTEDNLVKAVVAVAEEYYTRKEERLGADFMSKLERHALLVTIDEKWRDHLRAMDDLKEGIHLRSYGQKNPLVEYKSEGFKMFVELVKEINRDAVNFAFKFYPRVVERAAAPARQGQAPADEQAKREDTSAQGLPRVTSVSMGSMKFSQPSISGLPSGNGQPQQQVTNAGDAAAKRQPVTREEPRIGRNDPCPCGSGKKYKQCHGRK